MSKEKEIKKKERKEIQGKSSETDARCCYVVDPCGCYVDPRGCYVDLCC